MALSEVSVVIWVAVLSLVTFPNASLRERKEQLPVAQQVDYLQNCCANQHHSPSKHMTQLLQQIQCLAGRAALRLQQILKARC